MKNYSYPRVITSVTALPHSNARPAAEDTVVLFTPIISETGPANELVKIHSLEEFRNTFGLDRRLGLTLLNISNWLTAGGTLYTYRITNASSAVEAIAQTDDVADHTNETSNNPVAAKHYAIAKSKFVGSALNGYSLTLKTDGTKLEYVLLKDDGITRVEHAVLPLETVTIETTKTIDLKNKSEYLESITIIYNTDCFYSTKAGESGSSSSIVKTKVLSEIKFKNGSDGWNDTEAAVASGSNPGTPARSAFENALVTFWKDPKVIENHLETPIDLIMDAGYSLEIKKLMIEVISKTDKDTGEVIAIRPDINGYFDLGNISSSDLQTKDELTIKSALFSGSDCYKSTSNIFFYDQDFTISEEVYFDEDMIVYPSYFLSSMVPTVELSDGIQYPVAGKRRGELSGVKKISSNPTPDEKEDLFIARVNYVEKDSRGYYFMSQRVFDGSSEERFTGLSFINNARVACRMVHELEALGREYLFEFNDAITLANMSSVMNRYISNWIANRTLSFGNVEVTADPYSEEKVNAVLNIKFTNTIEVISIDLIIE